MQAVLFLSATQDGVRGTERVNLQWFYPVVGNELQGDPIC